MSVTGKFLKEFLKKKNNLELTINSPSVQIPIFIHLKLDKSVSEFLSTSTQILIEI